jgi:hypothetical protein
MQYNPWYYTHTGQRHGPVSNDELRKLIIERKIQPNICKLWQEGLDTWVPISEVEDFRPSLELIERLDRQHTTPKKEKYCSLGAMLDARRAKREEASIFAKLPKIGLKLRLGIALSASSLMWAWVNEAAAIPYLFAAGLSVFVTLFFAGPSTERTPRERFIAGCFSATAFVVAWYLGYLTNHGARIGESLFKSMWVNQPFAFLAHYIDAENAAIILTTFAVPFIFIGLFYNFLLAISRRGQFGTASFGSFGD